MRMTDGERRELYRRLLRVVNAAVNRTAALARAQADADDLVNEVWVHLLETRILDKVDPARGSAEQLVYVAACRHTLSLLRKRKRLAWRFIPADEGAIQLEMPAPGPEPVWLRLAHRDLIRALEHFNEDDRELLLLSLLYDLTAAEILAVREEPTDGARVGAMQKRLQRLKDKLGERLAEVVSTPGTQDRRFRKDIGDEGP